MTQRSYGPRALEHEKPDWALPPAEREVIAQSGRGISRDGADCYTAPAVTDGRDRVFGGRLLAQAITASADTLDSALLPHAVHAQFLRPTSCGSPTKMEVERLSDGRRFARRSVRLCQEGSLRAIMLLSFGPQGSGPCHEETASGIPSIEDLPNEAVWEATFRDQAPHLWQQLCQTPHPMEIRVIDFPLVRSGIGEMPIIRYLFRPTFIQQDSPTARASFLAYASDRFLLTSALVGHGNQNGNILFSSLDHALWIHSDPKGEEWLQYSVKSPRAGDGRAFAYGFIHSRDGHLIASAAQSGATAYATE